MSADSEQSLFRLLPSVESVMQQDGMEGLCGRWKRDLVVAVVSAEIGRLREGITAVGLSEESLKKEIESLPERVAERLEELTAPSFRRVVNATGIVVHTNLGRSPLAKAALERITDLAGRYMNLEYDLESGKRGKRDAGCRRLLRLLFPDFDALVVNNNAAAVLLALNTLADGREVAISRGQIIEIGESFRISEIQGKSGARLVEVGTTNRTYLKDFEEAIGPGTALLMTAHPSNYRVVGFTTQVPLAELAELAAKHSLPVVEDWGSGCLAPPGDYGIADEESAAEILAKGPDAICFSGDKLLGGPQAGIIVGKPEVVERMRSNHLYRALRVDKMTLLVLEETLRLYLSGRERTLPILELLGRPVSELRERAEALAKEIGSPEVAVVESTARVGGGAAPQVEIPSVALAVEPKAAGVESLKKRLRSNEPPVIVRVSEGKLLLDLRTVFADEDAVIAEALRRLLPAEK